MVLRPAFIPEVAHTYWNIGVAWKTKKEWTKAEASLKEAYAIFLQTLGEQHQDTKKCKAELDQLTKEIKANPKPPAQPATSKK